MSLGQALNQLVATLPQLLMLQIVMKLVFNDLMHIIMEPSQLYQLFRDPSQLSQFFRAEPVTEEKVLESVRKYNVEYSAPASWADVVFDFSPALLRRAVDFWWNSAEGKRTEELVKQTLDRLVEQGKLRKVEGCYVYG